MANQRAATVHRPTLKTHTAGAASYRSFSSSQFFFYICILVYMYVYFFYFYFFKGTRSTGQTNREQPPAHGSVSFPLARLVRLGGALDYCSARARNTVAHLIPSRRDYNCSTRTKVHAHAHARPHGRAHTSRFPSATGITE